MKNKGMLRSRRSKRPRDPCNFSIRLEQVNLGRLDVLHKQLALDNRNRTINKIIQDYSQFQASRELLESLQMTIGKGVLDIIKSRDFRKLLRDMIRTEITKGGSRGQR